MARGKGCKKAARYQHQPETPVRNRLREVVANRNASPELVYVSQSPPLSASNPDNTTHTSLMNSIDSRSTSHATNDRLLTTFSEVVSPLHSSGPILEQVSKRIKKHDNHSTRAESSAPLGSVVLATVDNGGRHQRDRQTRITSVQLTVGNCHFAFRPTKGLYDRVLVKPLTETTEKWDSVTSADWEEAKIGESTQARPWSGIWRKESRISSWRPFMVYHWLRMFVLAVVQGFEGCRRIDFIITFGALFACLYVASTALDFIATGLIKGIKAQDIVEAANCSVMYVTIPGSIITVSLIAASPTNPARGTYYYSVINSTTEWLNSIVPPGRFSPLVTQTSQLVPGASSSGFYESVTVRPTTISAPALSMSEPSGVHTMLTVTITSGEVVKTSAVTSLLSTVPFIPIYSSSSAALPDSSRRTSAPLAQPSRPYPHPYITTPLNPALTSLITVTFVITTTSTFGQGSETSSSNMESPELWSSTSVTSAPSSPDTTATDRFDTVTSTPLVMISTILGRQSTTLTSTSTTLIVETPSSTLLAPNYPPVLSSSSAPRLTLPGVHTNGSSNSATLPSVPSMPTSSTKFPPSSSHLSTAVTSLILNGQSSITTLDSSSSVGFTTTVSSAVHASTVSLAATTITFSGEQNMTGRTSPPTTASSTVTSSGDEFTVSLSNPVTGGYGTITTVPTISGLTKTSTAVATSAPSTSHSASATISRTPKMSSSGTQVSTAPLSRRHSTRPTLSPSSSISVSMPSSMISISSGNLKISATSSSSLPGSSSSVASSTLAHITSAIVVSNESFRESAAISSVAISSLSILSSAASFGLSKEIPSSKVGTLPTPSSSGTSAISASLTETASTSRFGNPPAAITTVFSGFNSSTFSSSITNTFLSSSSSAATTSGNVTSPLTTTISVFKTSSSSDSTLSLSSPSSVPLVKFASSSLSSLHSLNSSRPGMRGLATSSSVPSSSMDNNPVNPEAPSSNFFNTTSVNASITMSSTLLSSSVFVRTTSSVRSFRSLFTSVASNSISPTADGIPSSIILSSIFRSTLASTLALTTAPVAITSTSALASESTSALQIRALMTRIISYGETSFVFVFPTQTIVTTQSYWTGTYPTVTGPEPSDLQTVSLTTTSGRQTPLSGFPPFELFTTSSRLRTVVNTVARAAATPTESDEPPVAEPTNCGESGNFTLSFDDTTVGPNERELLVASGLKNPYHHLFYANGFTNVPDNWEPYPAISQPNVAMFLPLGGRLLPNTAFAGTLLPGEIGAGPRASVTAYWFNAYSGYFGCALAGVTPCTLRISGYRYDAVLREEVLVAEQNVTLPACWAYANCQLTQVLFSDGFKALSGIQFNAFTYNLGIPQVHMMDDLQLEWYNNTCSAGIWRIGHL